MNQLGILTISFLLAVQPSYGEHVVFIQTCASYSHRVAEWPLALALAEKGHNVTFISPFHSKSHLASPKVKDLSPKPLRDFMEACMADNFDVNHRANGLMPPLYTVIDDFCYHACEALHKSQEFKEWVNSGIQVDLIVSDIMPDCANGLAKKFNAKSILYSVVPMIIKNFEPFGINPETASVPDIDFPGPFPLSFFTRVKKYLLPFYFRIKEHIFHGKYIALFSEELNVTDSSNMDELRDSQSLIIINGDYITDYPRSFPAFVVKVHGIHLKKEAPPPLPKELEDFINVKEYKGNKVDGFIFMSFGTVARAPSLPLDLREMFFRVFEAFPNIRFMWRWEGDRPAKYPGNLYLVPWVNQNSVLAHPKIKAFLTQAGRPSVQESIHYGVPMITFPVLADQDVNARRMEMLDVAINLDFVGLTEEKLSSSISKILTDKRYKERTEQLKRLVDDVPMDPVDTAVWWTEFVMRHTKEELNLLKPTARHLTWYEKRDLDVLFFLFAILFTMAYVSYKILRMIFLLSLSRKEIPNSPSANSKNKSKQKMS